MTGDPAHVHVALAGDTLPRHGHVLALEALLVILVRISCNF